MTKPKILIIGAGTTGLTAAVELARRGIKPVVIEKRKTASNLSRAVGILPHSMDLLGPSGVAKYIKQDAIAFRQMIFHYRNKQLAQIKLNQMKDPNNRLFGLAQDRTETHLRDAFTSLGGKIVYGAELLSLSQSETGVSVSIMGKAFRFDIVIGADGVNSTVRDALHIPFDGYELPETWSIADVYAVGWKNPRDFQAFVLDHGGVVVVVPLEKARFRIISNRPDALANLPIHMKVTNVHCTSDFKISVRQAKRYQLDRVFLAGDAAHCHSPVGGRGMNLGIADAVDLAERIVSGTTGGYHKARHPFGRSTIKLSERTRQVLTSTNPITRFFVRSFMRLVNRSPRLQSRFVRNALDLDTLDL